MFLVAALFRFDVRIRPAPAIVYLAPAASVLFAPLAMIISRRVHRSDAPNTAGSTVRFSPMFLTGVFLPLETMAGYLQGGAKLLPLTYLNDAMRAATRTGSTRATRQRRGGVWTSARIQG